MWNCETAAPPSAYNSVRSYGQLDQCSLHAHQPAVLMSAAWDPHKGQTFVLGAVRRSRSSSRYRARAQLNVPSAATGSARRTLELVDTRCLRHDEWREDVVRPRPRRLALRAMTSPWLRAQSWMVPNAHADIIRDVAWSPLVPYWFASAGDDGTVHVWDVRYGVLPVRSLELHTNRVTKVGRGVARLTAGRASAAHAGCTGGLVTHALRDAADGRSRRHASVRQCSSTASVMLTPACTPTAVACGICAWNRTIRSTSSRCPQAAPWPEWAGAACRPSSTSAYRPRETSRCASPQLSAAFAGFRPTRGAHAQSVEMGISFVSRYTPRRERLDETDRQQLSAQEAEAEHEIERLVFTRDLLGAFQHLQRLAHKYWASGAWARSLRRAAVGSPTLSTPSPRAQHARNGPLLCSSCATQTASSSLPYALALAGGLHLAYTRGARAGRTRRRRTSVRLRCWCRSCPRSSRRMRSFSPRRRRRTRGWCSCSSCATRCAAWLPTTRIWCALAARALWQSLQATRRVARAGDMRTGARRRCPAARARQLV
jgi:hypothetical protein